MAYRIFFGALLVLLFNAGISQAITIPVSYQGTSWVDDGVPIAISTATVGTGIQNMAPARAPSQSFTTTSAFTLDKIWIAYTEVEALAGNYSMELKLFEVADPNASNMVLGTNLFSQPQQHTFISSATDNKPVSYAAFDVENIALKANQGYLFMFQVAGTGSPGFPFRWAGFGNSDGTGVNVYSGGRYYRQDRSPQGQNWDQVFALQSAPPPPPPPQVNLPPIAVATPEPAVPLLAMLGGFALLRRRTKAA